MEETQEFLKNFQQCLEKETFVKLTLSKPAQKGGSLRNIYGRPVEIKGRHLISFTLRHRTQDITKNLDPVAAIPQVEEWLGQDMLNGDLFTTEQDVSIQFSKKRKARLFRRPPSQTQRPSTQHDKQKKRLVQSEGKQYLQKLEIVGKDGNVRKSGQKKFRQINKYIEIIESVIKQSNLPDDPHIVDMGSGKGYLTFALYDYLRQAGRSPVITGIELRQNLVDFCNQLAREEGFADLNFLASDIHDYHPERIDMLIALHACDIATDIAIAKGIKANASVIIVAPCCHKQIRKEMDCHTPMQSILRHGIMEERQAELVTDGLRALLMEDRGYQTRVFEFISTEHTPKNLMIVGTKGKRNEKAQDDVAAIKQTYGIRQHYLETLLNL